MPTLAKLCLVLVPLLVGLSLLPFQTAPTTTTVGDSPVAEKSLIWP
ncbi:hypothetical protein [Streptomyces sp. NPDC001165]